MVPKQALLFIRFKIGFRAVLFRMVPKQKDGVYTVKVRFRAVLFRMVPKRSLKKNSIN